MTSKEGPCTISGCSNDRFGNGMCSKHYFRERRAEKRRIEGVKERKVRSDRVEDVLANPEDFWQFVKEELGIK